MRENYSAIMKTVLIALVFFLVGSVIGVMFIPPGLRSMLSIAFFIAVLFSIFASRESWISTKKRMYSYATLLGILTGATYLYYLATLGANLFFSCVLGVVLVFALAYFSAARLSEQKVFALSPIVWGGIVGLLILEFINIFFFRFGTFDLLLSTAGILIYSVYGLMMMKSIQQQCRWENLSEGQVVHLAYGLFISFLNLLLDLLRLVSIIKQRD